MTFCTRSIFEAACIMATGCAFRGMEGDSRRYQFLFDNSDGTATRRASDYLHNSPIAPRDFADAYSNLKRQVLYARDRERGL